MSFVPFNDQYDEVNIQLVPFDLMRDCYGIEHVVLTIDIHNAFFSEVVKLSQDFAKKLNTKFELCFQKDMPSIDLTIQRVNGSCVHYEGAKNPQEFVELIQSIETFVVRT